MIKTNSLIIAGIGVTILLEIYVKVKKFDFVGPFT